MKIVLIKGVEWAIFHGLSFVFPPSSVITTPAKLVYDQLKHFI
jgi:hypothetical protein